MLKLPLCPYCGARFLYPDVKRSKNGTTGTCPHCGRVFRIFGRGSRAVLFLVFALILIGLDLCLLSIPSINLTVLLAATILGVAGVRLLIPYTVRYGPL
jgi:DNA-directed RNA polymerase subunit RPC12/RpoP